MRTVFFSLLISCFMILLIMNASAMELCLDHENEDFPQNRNSLTNSDNDTFPDASFSENEGDTHISFDTLQNTKGDLNGELIHSTTEKQLEKHMDLHHYIDRFLKDSQCIFGKLPKEIRQQIFKDIDLPLMNSLSGTCHTFRKLFSLLKLKELFKQKPALFEVPVRGCNPYKLVQNTGQVIKNISIMNDFVLDACKSESPQSALLLIQAYEKLYNPRIIQNIKSAWKFRFSPYFCLKGGRKDLEKMLNTYDVDREKLGQTPFMDFVLSMVKDPYISALFNTALVGGVTVGGYFLISQIYSSYFSYYSSPNFHPDGGSVGSDCWQLNSCECYRNQLSAPFNFSNISSILPTIKAKCNLSEVSTSALGNYIEAQWNILKTINPKHYAGGYANAQCFQEGYVQSKIAYHGDPIDKKRILASHPHLIDTVVARYNPECLVANSYAYLGAPIGWGFLGVVVLFICNCFVFCFPG